MGGRPDLRVDLVGLGLRRLRRRRLRPSHPGLADRHHDGNPARPGRRRAGHLDPGPRRPDGSAIRRALLPVARLYRIADPSGLRGPGSRWPARRRPGRAGLPSWCRSASPGCDGRRRRRRRRRRPNPTRSTRRSGRPPTTGPAPSAQIRSAPDPVAAARSGQRSWCVSPCRGPRRRSPSRRVGRLPPRNGPPRRLRGSAAATPSGRRRRRSAPRAPGRRGLLVRCHGPLAPTGVGVEVVL